MTIAEEVALNQFGQGLTSHTSLLVPFHHMTESAQREHLTYLVFLLLQSRAVDADIEQGLLASALKRTYTPCVLLRKFGIQQGIPRLLKLPTPELSKVYQLLLYVFKEAYQRRYVSEKSDPNKWWYWDLSNNEKVKEILAGRTSIA